MSVSRESTRLTDAMLAWADRVITVCGHADEFCPVLPPGTQKVHWPLEDPAKANGSDDQIMTTFRATREEVRRRVSELLERLRAESPGSRLGVSAEVISRRTTD